MTAALSDEQFAAAALRRIYILMAVLGGAGTLAVLFWKGWLFAAGFAGGAAVGGLNFHWLKAAVDALASRFSGTEAPAQPAPSARRVALRFILRYVLIAVLAYVIFLVSPSSLVAFLAGLLVFVAAILAEMIYELTLGIPDA